jgi:hypothetical protein
VGIVINFRNYAGIVRYVGFEVLSAVAKKIGLFLDYAESQISDGTLHKVSS